MSFSSVGIRWTPATLAEYLKGRTKPLWAKAVCIHYTAAPSLAQRPDGFTAQHIINIQDFYKSKGWNRGPHFFTDDDDIFGMTPVDEKGIHAVSFNSMSIGIECLGSYDAEDPTTGRGLKCMRTTAAATAVLLKWLGLSPDDEKTILFHRFDPKTSKTCPGKKVDWNWFNDLVREFFHGERDIEIPVVPDPKPAIPQGESWTEWNWNGKFWAVPVARFMSEIQNISFGDAAAKLARREDGVYYGDELLEGAVFVGGETWADAAELLAIPAA